MKKFGVVTPWINLTNAEYEVIERMRVASKNIGVELVLMDNYGVILDAEQKRTDKIQNPRELEFIMSLHYESPKFLDNFYYSTLWNPPYYVIRYEYKKSIENYHMQDVFIGYDSDPVYKHANAMLHDSKAKILRSPTFVASPANVMYKPNLSNPRMFYCGINFERGHDKIGRHFDLFKQLEESGELKIFGPEKFGSFKPWEGYSSYCGQIPFDGKSMMEEISKCGVVLMLSSEVHRRYDTVTSRIYEAAAAGAIVIANKSDFLEKEFGDCILTIDYGIGSQEGVAEQILKHFEWIKKNPGKAEAKARKLQQIFVEKFCMEKQLKELFRQHKDIKKKVEQETYSNDQKETVDILLNWDSDKTDRLEEVVGYINNQKYQNLRIIAGFDNSIVKKCTNILDKKLNKQIKREVLGFDIFNHNLPKSNVGYIKLGNGTMIGKLAELSNANYCTFVDSKTIWFSDHITTLKRTLEDNKSKEIAYSGIFSKEMLSNGLEGCVTLNFKTLHFNLLNHFDIRFSMSSLMLRKSALDKYKTGFFEVLDGFEFFLVAFDGLAHNSSIFSGKMTSGTTKIGKEVRGFALEPKLQISYIKSLFRNHLDFPAQEETKKVVVQKGNPTANKPLNIEKFCFQGIFIREYLIKKYKRTTKYKIIKLLGTNTYKKFKGIEKAIKQ